MNVQYDYNKMSGLVVTIEFYVNDIEYSLVMWENSSSLSLNKKIQLGLMPFEYSLGQRTYTALNDMTIYKHVKRGYCINPLQGFQIAKDYVRLFVK